VIYLFFFFSSRRRHTRSKRDWSSDVCSSDLVTRNRRTLTGHCQRRASFVCQGRLSCIARDDNPTAVRSVSLPHPRRGKPSLGTRSEERRVGKESRAQRSPDESNKNKEAIGRE